MNNYTLTISFRAEDFDDAQRVIANDSDRLWDSKVLHIECGERDNEFDEVVA